MKSDKNNRRIRKAQLKDRDRLYRLWQDCFHDSDAFSDYYFDTYFQENTVWLLETDGDIKAMLHLNPYSISLYHQKVDTCYIVGVATDADYRHQGAMTCLLQKVFEETYERSVPFVYLMPADEAIYTPFQFAFIYKQMVETKEAQQLSATQKDALRITVKSAEKKADLEFLAQMANAVLTQYYGMYTWRDAHYFERLAMENRTDGGDLLMVYAGETCVGYLSYAMEGKIEVREVFCEKEWRSEFVQWFENCFADRLGEILSLTPDGFLSACRKNHTFYRPIIMGRIVDLSEWMQMLPVGDHDFEICIQVHDQWVEKNHATWHWQVKNGKNSWQKTDKLPDVRMGIDALMQWLTGYLPIDEMITAGLVTLQKDCRDRLEKVPVLKGIFINEII